MQVKPTHAPSSRAVLNQPEAALCPTPLLPCHPSLRCQPLFLILHQASNHPTRLVSQAASVFVLHFCLDSRLKAGSSPLLPPDDQTHLNKTRGSSSVPNSWPRPRVSRSLPYHPPFSHVTRRLLLGHHLGNLTTPCFRTLSTGRQKDCPRHGDGSATSRPRLAPCCSRQPGVPARGDLFPSLDFWMNQLLTPFSTDIGAPPPPATQRVSTQPALTLSILRDDRKHWPGFVEPLSIFYESILIPWYQLLRAALLFPAALLPQAALPRMGPTIGPPPWLLDQTSRARMPRLQQRG